MERKVHVGEMVHQLQYMAATPQGDPEDVMCQAAVVTEIVNRQTGEVWLKPFPRNTVYADVIAYYGKEHGNWHFIDECPTDS